MSYLSYDFPHTRNQDSDLRQIVEMYRKVADVPQLLEELEEFIKTTDATIEKTTKEWLESNLPNIIHPYILVDDFGAVGDGVTDDTQAIQNAINYAASNNKYVVFTPLKSYFINTVTNYAALRLPSNTHIVGNYATLIAGDNLGYNFLIVNDANGISGGYSANSNINIDSLQIDGQYLVSTLIGIGHAQQIRITNCSFKSLSGWHMIELNAVKDGIIDKCAFREYMGSETSEMVQLDCMKDKTVFPAFGPYDGAHCSGIRITNCYFANFAFANRNCTIGTAKAAGIGNHSALLGHEPHEVIISHNVFENLTQGIKFVNLAGATIANNMMLNCYVGIVCEGGRVLNTIITSNEIYGHSSEAGALQCRGITIGANVNTADNRAFKVNIIANVVANFLDYGISLNGANSLIADNIISDIIGRLDETTQTRKGGRGLAVAYSQENVTFRGNFIRTTNEANMFIFNFNSSNIKVIENDAQTVHVNEQSDSTYFINNFISGTFGNANNVKHMNNIVGGALDSPNI